MAETTVSGLEAHLNAPPGSIIVVEAGHIYTHELPSEEHKLSAEIGADACKQLEKQGYKPKKWLLIDDYNPKLKGWPELLDENQYVDMLTEWGFEPAVVIHEADLVEPAQQNLAELVSKNMTKSHNGKTFLKDGWIFLHDNDPQKYSCAMLDACLYQEKAKAGASSITVLNKSFKDHQQKTHNILQALGESPSIIPCYYSVSEVPV